jgi:hypothetical protein
MQAESYRVEDFLVGLAKVNGNSKRYFIHKTGNCKLYCE